MEFVTYVLQSESSGRLYIGHTQDLGERLRRHQVGRNPSTKGRGPWKLLSVEAFPTRSEAMQHEQWLKAKKSPRRVMEYIESLSR